MKKRYIVPEAELICFRPVEYLMYQDGFNDTMKLFNVNHSEVPTASEDIEVNPWGDIEVFPWD